MIILQSSKFLLPALTRTVLFPVLLGYYLGRYLSLALVWRSVVFVASIPLLYAAKSEYEKRSNDFKASKLGARAVPRVRGKWMLNLDIMREWSRSGRDEEVGWMLNHHSAKYGKTYNTRVLGEDQIITLDPAVIRHVLVDDFENFVKGEKFYERAYGFLGDGIFNSDGDRWKFHRTLTRPFFHPAHISPDAFIPLIKRFMVTLVSDQPMDIQFRLGRLALEISIVWLCGFDISQEPSAFGPEWEAAKDGLGDALIAAQRIVGRRVKIGTVWPLFELGRDPLLEPMTVIRNFFGPLIKKANSDRLTIENPSLIHRLLDSTEDLKLVEDQLINLLLASRDTTTSMLTFMVYTFLLHYPIASRLREEVRSVAGYDGVVNKEIIRDLKYCRAFINETLRVFPPVPLNIRRTVRSSLLPSSSGGPPLYMPANTSIVTAPILAHRDPDVWGSDADKFKPDRWANISSEERAAYFSWHGGPRMCLGQPLGLTVAHTFLILLCQHMDDIGPMSLITLDGASIPESCRVPDKWLGDREGRLRHGQDVVWICGDVVLSVKGGLWVRFLESEQP